MDNFLGVFFGTFLLEDAAIASALALVYAERMTLEAAFLACASGIGVGDLLLFGLGRLMVRYPKVSAHPRLLRVHTALEKLAQGPALDYAVVLCRAIPGTRFVTYVAAGFSGYPLGRFTVITVVTVLAWVLVIFGGGVSLLRLFTNHWVLGITGFLVFLSLIRWLTKVLLDPWLRKAMMHRWRKFLQFEFWPSWLFYPPIYLYCIWLAIKHRHPFLPLYANPGTHHAGLIGESKWDLYRHLKPSAHRLETFLVEKGSYTQILDALTRGDIGYPFILKPDVGQRGFGVRVIRDKTDLDYYLAHADFAVIVQEFCPWRPEAGIFYYRIPGQETGALFSLTDKRFPDIVGDGATKVGDLILRDPRARIIAPTYFERLRSQLDRVLMAKEVMPLATCGNHCQGTIFLNGNSMMTAELLRAVESVAKEIPGFYFGRFDVRYLSPEDLVLGRNFKIVEVNGAGSEATHIWDARTRLLDAYATLFKQWDLLYFIGREVRRLKLPHQPVSIRRLLKDIWHFRTTKSDLSISS